MGHRPYDEKVKEWTMKSLARHFEQLNLTLHKGTKARYKAFAASRGTSVTAMFTQFMESEIEKAGFEYHPETEESTGEE